jgi:hypothetical protein
LVWFVPIDHAGELNESAVPGILDDASVMIGDFGIENGISKSFQFRQSVFFVDPYQAARARDIRRQNSCQSPLYVIEKCQTRKSPILFDQFVGAVEQRQRHGEASRADSPCLSACRRS